MGLDLDFNNFDLGNIDAINIDNDILANFGFNNDFDNFDLGDLDVDNGMNYSANFNFEVALKEAELSLGPRET